MRQYLKNKHFKNTLIVILICLIAVVATIYCISESNARKEEVKSLVRKYDLTTEENSSATLIVKSRLSDKKLEELGAEQIVKYGAYKVVKFSSQEDMEERLAELQEQKVEVEVDTLVDVATILSETTSTKTNETTPSTPEKSEDTLQQYLENNPSKEIVKVAIIDTGIDKENELFKDRIIDTQLNYSTTGEENDITDDYGHGTIIAEIIAKKTDSNIKLMPIKVANKNGKSTVLSVYMAINEAISQGADVINISMNTFSQSDLLREAIDKANEVGIKVVVSSGNLGIDVENIAPSNIESAIVVGAVHSNLDYEGFSNYGDTVDYCSYGVYDSNYGTSISAAHISAVIAALESTGVKPTEIEGTIDSYIKDLGEPGKDKYYGKGFISLYNGDECFTLDGDEEAKVNANRRKEMLQKLLDADWKSMTDAELNALFSDTHYDIIGYFLKTLSEEDFNEIISRDTQLQDPITVGTAFIINDVSEIENVNWPDIPDKEYGHTYEYCLTLCDDSMSTSGTDDRVDEWVSTTAEFKININGSEIKLQISGLKQPFEFKDTLDSIDNNKLNSQNFGIGYYTIDPTTGGEYKFNKGTAYVLSEQYGNPVTMCWQGVYIRGASYTKPAHSHMIETEPTNRTEGRINIGYITSKKENDTWKVEGNLLDTTHKKSKIDTIDIECNSYNCGLSSLGGKEAPAEPGATLNLLKKTYVTQIEISSGSGKIWIGGKYVERHNKYDLNCGETIGINSQSSYYKPTRRGYEFIGWQIIYTNTNTKPCDNKKHYVDGKIEKNIHLPDIDCKVKVCSSQEGAKIKLIPKFVKVVPPTNTPTPTPTATPTPKPESFSNTLKVKYLENSNENNVLSTTYSEEIELSEQESAVYNSKLISDDLYPDTYKRTIQGYTYKRAALISRMYPVDYADYYKLATGGSAYRCIDPNCANYSTTDKNGKCYTGNLTEHSFINKNQESNNNNHTYLYKATAVGDLTATHMLVPKETGQRVLRPIGNNVYLNSSRVYVYRVDDNAKYDMSSYARFLEGSTTAYVRNDVLWDLSTNNKFNIRNEAHGWILKLLYERNEYDLHIDPNGGKLNANMNTGVIWDTKYRYGVDRKLMHANPYQQGGDTNPTAYGLPAYDLYNINPVKDGYLLDSSYTEDGVTNLNGWTHDGSGTLSYNASTLLYTYKPGAGETEPVTLTAHWKPANYTLTLHTRLPQSSEPTHRNSTDTILTGASKTTNSSGQEVTTYSKVATYATTYTYDKGITFCIGDGTKQQVIDGFVTPYCKGFELVGFSTDPSSYTPDTTNIKCTIVNGIKYWIFDGHLDAAAAAGNVDLYPIWKEKSWTLTVNTKHADQKLSDINIFEAVNKNCGFTLTDDTKCKEQLKASIVNDYVYTIPFYYSELDSAFENTTVIQDTCTDTTYINPNNKKNAIKTKLTKYGNHLPSDLDIQNAKYDWIPYGHIKPMLTMVRQGDDYYTYRYSNSYDGNLEVSANWQPNEHNLTIDANGGEFILSNGNKATKYTKTISYGNNEFGLTTEAYDMTSQKNGAVTTPTRYGYDFMGWKITSGRGQIEIVDADTREVIKVDSTRKHISLSDVDLTDDDGNELIDETSLIELSYQYEGYTVNSNGYKSKFDEDKYAIVSDVIGASDKKYLYYYNSEPNKEAGDNGLNWDGDVTIQAQWKPHQHTLTIDNNGGRYTLKGNTWQETDIWSKTFTFDQPEPFSTKADGVHFNYKANSVQIYPVRYGYTFGGYDDTSDLRLYLGWKVSELSEYEKSSWLSPISVGQDNYGTYTVPTFYYNSRLDKDVTITAQWTQNLYNLTVDPNGGEFYRPTNENGIAIGWTKEKYTRKFAFDKLTTFSTKNKIIRVDYKKDDTDPYNVIIDGAVSEPWRRGYTFTGWSNPLNNSGQYITTNDIGEKIQNKVIDTEPSSKENGAWKYTADYAGDVTISAIWNNGQTTGSGDPYGNDYTIKYEKGLTDCSDDKLPTPNPQSANYDKDVTLHTKGNLLGRSYKITLDSGLDKGGTGIYIAEDGEYRDVSTRDTYTITENTISGNLEFRGWDVQKETNTETGNWAKNSEGGPEYKLYTYETVNYAGGQTVTKANFTSVPNGQVTATARYYKKTITLYTPSMTGYEFQGWYTEPNGGGTKVNWVDIAEDTSKYEITLYAYWKPIKYNIRYNGNGHWNTTQGVYTQELTFDKPQILTACKFTRNATNPGYTYNGDKLVEGYSFVGWEKGTSGEDKTPFVQTAIGTGKSITYTDKASGIFNLTATKGATIDLYAIWKKSLSVAFKLNGGLYSGASTIDTLEATIWNSTYEYTFDITKYFGTVTNNGLNSKLGKVDEAGNIYRFLGWSLNKDAVVPDSNFIVYDSNRANYYTIHDDKTLYAVWEKILVVDYTLTRTVADLPPAKGSITPQLKNITAITNNPIASIIIRPGEQGSYRISMHGTPDYADTIFTEKATNIYKLPSLSQWKEELNPVVADEALSTAEVCGLNKKWASTKMPSNIIRTFYVPLYYNDAYPNENFLAFTHTIQQESYYYKNWVSGKDKEEITITSIVYLNETAPGDTSSSSITSTLDELKSLIKTKIVK